MVVVTTYALQGGTVLIAQGLALCNGVASITLLQLVAGRPPGKAAAKIDYNCHRQALTEST
jgi:hypothetical protein